LPREQIPRSIERGHIEACHAFHAPSSAILIPRSIERGHIEATSPSAP